MPSNDIPGWISAIASMLSLIVALIALVKSRNTEAKTKILATQMQTLQVAQSQPVMYAVGGNGGFGGGGGGASVSNVASQTKN